MTPDLAVAAISLAIRQRLQAALNRGGDLGGEVRTERPDKVADTGTPLVNLYLYHVNVDPFRRNDDLDPVVRRRPRGDGFAVPATQIRSWEMPLTLRYLLSFYGDDRTLVPQRLMGVCVAALHRRPIVEARAVDAVAASLLGADAPAPEAAVADVTLTFDDLGLEDGYRLWSVFKAPYALSVGYTAGTAIVGSDPVVSAVDLVERLDLAPTPVPRPA